MWKNLLLAACLTLAPLAAQGEIAPRGLIANLPNLEVQLPAATRQQAVTIALQYRLAEGDAWAHLTCWDARSSADHLQTALSGALPPQFQVRVLVFGEHGLLEQSVYTVEREIAGARVQA